MIFKNRKDCFQLFSLSFILIFCVTEHRAEWIWTYLTPVTNVVRSPNHGAPCCVFFWIPFFQGWTFSKRSARKSLDARHQAEAVRPADDWRSFTPPRNGHKVKVNSDTWQMLACPLKLYKPVHVYWLQNYILFGLSQITQLNKIRPWLEKIRAYRKLHWE